MAGVKQKREKSTTNSLIEFVVIIAVALGLAIGIQAFLVKPFRIPSESMVPTLTIGQRVLVNRIGTHFGDPSRGDIVVFKPPAGANDDRCGIPSEPADGHPCGKPTGDQSEDNFIKRVIGLPGDTIAVRGNHAIVNGKQLDEPYVNDPAFTAKGCSNLCNLEKPITVPPDHYFMMGDNRGASDDSRAWGPVPKDWIIGGAFFTYWPPSRIGTL